MILERIAPGLAVFMGLICPLYRARVWIFPESGPPLPFPCLLISQKIYPGAVPYKEKEGGAVAHPLTCIICRRWFMRWEHARLYTCFSLSRIARKVLTSACRVLNISMALPLSRSQYSLNSCESAGR